MCCGWGVSSGSKDAASWNEIVAEYQNMFKPTGMPAERETVHWIKVKPGFVLSFMQQYHVLTADLAQIIEDTLKMKVYLKGS